MKCYLLLTLLLASLATAQSINNKVSSAYASCYDAYLRDPLATNGYYYITNNGAKVPYLTYCVMSINGGGWTLYYANNNYDDSSVKKSYSEMLESPSLTLTGETVITSNDSVGMMNVEGLNAVSVMAVEVTMLNGLYSAATFPSVSDLNAFLTLSAEETNCTSLETPILMNEKTGSLSLTGYQYKNGALTLKNCVESGASDVAYIGRVDSNADDRVLSCAGIPGAHCLYFVRENVYDANRCMCSPVGHDGVIWYGTDCGKSSTVSCSSTGSLTRLCSAEGIWSTSVTGSCNCPVLDAYDLIWPVTVGGGMASIHCLGGSGYGYTRNCHLNGQWDNVINGVCSCNAVEFSAVTWPTTQGATTAYVSCSSDASLTSAVLGRACSVRGIWSNTVSGSCKCSAAVKFGAVWTEAESGATQTVVCSSQAEGTNMKRTCTKLGEWSAVTGRCYCKADTHALSQLAFPQTTSGDKVVFNCDVSAASNGVPYERECLPGGVWSDVTMGSCQCRAAEYKNNVGDIYSFPQTVGDETITQVCIDAEDGEITRKCSKFGKWESPSGCEEPLFCNESTLNNILYTTTKGGDVAIVPCTGHTGLSYARPCSAAGVWGDVTGYCACEGFVDSQSMEWPMTATGETVSLPCSHHRQGNATRVCSAMGEWSEPITSCDALLCESETVNGVHYETTPAGVTVRIHCDGGDDIGYTRICGANGEWYSPITGTCRCPLYVDEFDSLWAESSPNTHAIHSCPNGLHGRMLRYCNPLGVWGEETNECGELACLSETYNELQWARTLAGTVGRVTCPNSSTRTRTRVCNSVGEWSEEVSGDVCTCAYTTVPGPGNELYVFPESLGGTVVSQACKGGYTGVMKYACSIGGTWKPSDVTCSLPMCAEEVLNGIQWSATQVLSVRSVTCGAFAVGNGYSRECLASGQWSNTVTGECSCAAGSQVYLDNTVYSFDQTAAGKTIVKECANGFAGSVSRSCDVTGVWKAMTGDCSRRYCDSVVESGVHWPMSNSMTTVTRDCGKFESGQLSRTCGAMGSWSEVVSECYNTQCSVDQVTYSVVASPSPTQQKCIEIRLSNPAGLRFANVLILPTPSAAYKSPVQTALQSLEICDVLSNVRYSVFVKFSEKRDFASWAGACLLNNVIHSQTCEPMKAMTITSQVPDSAQPNSRTLYFSVEFTSCSEPETYEIAYRCVSNCNNGDTTTHSLYTPCEDLDNCVANSIATISISDAFTQGATYEFTQRVLSLNSTIETTHSPVKLIVMRNLLSATDPKPSLAPMQTNVTLLNSRTVLLALSGVDSLLYRQHKVLLYRLSSAIGVRLLEDALVSETSLCETCSSDCFDSCSELSLELTLNPLYSYRLLVQSVPIDSYADITTTTHTIDTTPIPTVTMSVTPGDYFVVIELSSALMDLSGYCSVINKDNSRIHDQTVTVSYAATKQDMLSVTVSGLAIRSKYIVSCVLYDTMNIEVKKVSDVETVAVFAPLLYMNVIRDTPTHVHLSIMQKKPGDLYCKAVLYSAPVPTAQQLLSGASHFVSGRAMVYLPYSVAVDAQTLGAYYRVYCLTTDLYMNSAISSIIIHSSLQNYVPMVIRSSPMQSETAVVPSINAIELEFESKVSVKECEMCMFVLVNNGNSNVILILRNDIHVVDSVVSVVIPDLEPNTKYTLIATDSELIRDSVNSAVFTPNPLTQYLTFTTMSITQFEVSVVVPEENEVIAVNAVIQLEIGANVIINPTAVMKLNNDRSIFGSNACIQLRHQSAATTSVSVPISECFGVLDTATGYSLQVSDGFFRSVVVGLDSRVTTRVFSTNNDSGTLQVIESSPPHYADVVPTDVQVKLFFNMPVRVGFGYLFISDSDGFVINLSANRAVVMNSFPYELSWKQNQFTLNPSKKYTITWSEGLVSTLNGTPLSASTADTEIEFWTGSSRCSSDFVADRTKDVFSCVFSNNVCQCNSANVVALTHNKV